MRSPSQLQADVASFLTSVTDPVINGEALPLQNVAIIRAGADQEAGDGLTYDRILKALRGETVWNGKWGMAIVINKPEMVNGTPNSALIVEDATLIIEIVEDMTTNADETNGTGVTLDDCRAAVALLLHGWSHDGKHALTAERSDLIPEDALEAGKRGWQLTFRSKVHAHTMPTRVTRPVIAITGDWMTLTCATSGAAIYYTTDGSSPERGTDLYAEAVDIGELPSGTRIRVAAYKDGLRPSDTAEVEI